MRVLLLHNRYTQPGGEDVVFRAEVELLRSRGHEVVEFVEDNRRLNGVNPLRAAVEAIWSRESYRRIKGIIRRTRPQLAHFHNTFLRISPAAYYACNEEGVPVVQSLHNQRIFCAKATMYRNGQICERCVGKIYPWPALIHKCYHNSFAQTVVMTMMISLHQWLRTWQRQINYYIVFTEFFRKKFIRWGLPAEKIVVKPHFVYPDPAPRTESGGNYALFIGRLDPEKGVSTLVRAWRLVGDIPLKIRGDGQMVREIYRLAIEKPNVTLVPQLSRQDLFVLIKGSRFLVWPSEGIYENFGMVAIEAFACGVPVIASRTGVMTEIVEDGRTGLLFEPGDPEDLAEKVAWAWAHPREMAEMGREARREYEIKYTAERNYDQLMAIYRAALCR